MATAADVSAKITEIQGIVDTASSVAQQVAPGEQMNIQSAQTIIDLLAQLAAITASALSMANTMAINATTIAALDVDQTPL